MRLWPRYFYFRLIHRWWDAGIWLWGDVYFGVTYFGPFHWRIVW